MTFYAGIYFIPVYVQGVLGASATNSGAILIPMMLSLTGASIIGGQIVARTGRYRPVTVIGMSVAAVGFVLLARMDTSAPYYVVLSGMVLVGTGLGAGMQTFTLIVQNAVERKDLGVATATTLLFRSIGRTAGTAFLGTVLSQGISVEIGLRLPSSSVASIRLGGAASSVEAINHRSHPASRFTSAFSGGCA